MTVPRPIERRALAAHEFGLARALLREDSASGMLFDRAPDAAALAATIYFLPPSLRWYATTVGYAVPIDDALAVADAARRAWIAPRVGYLLSTIAEAIESPDARDVEKAHDRAHLAAIARAAALRLRSAHPDATEREAAAVGRALAAGEGGGALAPVLFGVHAGLTMSERELRALADQALETLCAGKDAS